MSLTQTYFIASSARSKLGREACKPDHDLRLLVGHANLLDSLMLELQQAEREQEAWFNHSIRKMEAEEEESRHIQWADPIMEDDEDDAASETSDSDSDSDLEDDFELAMPLRKIRTPAVLITAAEVDADYDSEEEIDDEEFGSTLMRVPSNQHPPELVQDSDESDDESPPASPPQPTMEYTEVQRKQAIATTGFFNSMKPLSESEQHNFMQEGFFIPERNNGLLIATC